MSEELSDYEVVELLTVISKQPLIQDESYIELIQLIERFLKMEANVFLEFDIISARILLKQAEGNNLDLTSSLKNKLSFILRCVREEDEQKLLIDEGFKKEKDIYKILDPHFYKSLLYIMSFLDEEKCRKYRKMFLEEVLTKKSLEEHLQDHCSDYIFYELYYSSDSSLKPLKQVIKDFIIDLVIEYFFDDYYQNVFIDITEIIKYLKRSKKTFNIRNLSFYQEVLKLEEMEIDDILRFFSEKKDINIIESFYDDIRLLKDDSYKSLTDCCTKFCKSSSLYNSKLSNKHGCDVYYLDGEEFYCFVRSDAGIYKKEPDYGEDFSSIVECPQPTIREVNRLSNSFTFIGKDNIATYKNPEMNLTLIYGGIDYHEIGHVFHDDSWTDNSYYISDFPNELHTPKSLLEESTGYTEIYINNLEGIYPVAFLCIDEITSWDETFAKENNLPIVLINSIKYSQVNVDKKDERYYIR